MVAGVRIEVPALPTGKNAGALPRLLVRRISSPRDGEAEVENLSAIHGR